MPPVAGVELLPKHQQIVRRRSWIGLSAEVGNVRYALLLINYQTLDHWKIFCRRLCHQILRSVPVCSAVIHMHMHVTADPARIFALRQVQRFQADSQACLLTDSHLYAPLFEAIFKSLHDLNIYAACWDDE